MDKKLNWILVCICFLLITSVASAQSGLSFDIPKPKKFENRKLGSEKTEEKKYTIPRKFMQNTISHYNYFFNSNEKIKEVLAHARADHKDDYSKLLSFYSYSLEETSKYKSDLDSVIAKSTAGILLHDLRTNWVDNFYLLIGQAYYFRKSLDSAYLTFQFLNYAFSPKEKDGYDKVIGSNSNEGGSAFSISTNEKRNIAKQLLSRPPSRNESLLWQIKTYLANDELPESAGLIQTLKYDPLFPSRLQADLFEVEAWYFYKQNAYDSAAFYLEKALDNAFDKQERARREYLIAQLYERSHHADLAQEFYNRTIRHTIDPVLEVYAILNSIRQDNSDEKAFQNAIEALTKMAKRDKYLNYRDIIYYTAAQMELDQKKDNEAKAFLSKSIKYSVNNPVQKSKSFLALADLSFAQKNFTDAKRWYDSVDISTIPFENQRAFGDRRQALNVISLQQGIIDRQDSLQRIAAMPVTDRDAFLKKLSKQLRKQQGLKDEDISFGNASNAFAGNNNNTPVDLFNAADAKADWYFSNTSLRSKGFGDFKLKWGSRPNVDNWQRSAVLQQQINVGKAPADLVTSEPVAVNAVPSNTYEGLLAGLPTTPEKLKVSNDSILHARFLMGQWLQDGLEDYPAAIDAYEKLLQQFPGSSVEERTLFNLYYCYTKTGNSQKAAQVKQSLESKFGNGKLVALLNNPQAADSLHKKSGEQLYDQIYNLFIEGKFDEALARKHEADSLYGKHYWTPQLLYIEAVYHVQQHDDSTAKKVLGQIIGLYPGDAMAIRAQHLYDVLSRRREIEEYLTNLKIERPKDDTNNIKIIEPPVQRVVTSTIVQNNPPNNPPAQQPVNNNKPITPKPDTVQIVKQPNANAAPSAYTYAPAQPHYAVLVMDKVDPVYVNEARNAFNRYHKEKYAGQTIEIIPLPLTDDTRLVLFGKFDNAAIALDYIDKAKKLAPTDIIPWMPAAKYSFVLISEQNLEVLKTKKDVADYKKFLHQNFPGAF